MISVDRAKTILECYGGLSDAWPSKERYALQQAISESGLLQEMQQEALVLDQFMAFTRDEDSILDDHSIDYCIQQVMKKLPAQVRPVKKKPVLDNLPISLRIKNFFENGFPVALIASIILLVVSLSFNRQDANFEQTDTLSLSDYMELYVDENYTQNNEQASDIEELEILAFLEPDLLEEDG